jgi:uncharacterized protein (DUF1697 family)
MTRYIAFLRAINIGHGRTLTMETLRKAFKPLDFTDLSTFIGSGNVIFEARERSPRVLEAKIEAQLEKALKIEVDTFVRTETELAQIAVYQPYPSALVDPEAEVNIIFLDGGLDELTAQKVSALATDTDEFVVHEREIYWLRRKKPGGPSYSTVALERVLLRPFTIRNSRTVRKIVAKYSEAYQSLANLA